MIAGAAVLGIVAGACTGYLIQADRAPTALPPLSQPVVGQAKGEVEPLSAAQDRRRRVPPRGHLRVAGGGLVRQDPARAVPPGEQAGGGRLGRERP
ncbi:hypothetical protein [Streptomyces sp. NPDC051677]|uniref:hypothetical protein n=1 Tax=Streptomyces sp. NPDC051677 TaxID=3365669 RepID=UPI0037D63882